MGANSFPYERTPVYMGGNNQHERVASPVSVASHLQSTKMKKRKNVDHSQTAKLCKLTFFRAHKAEPTLHKR